MSTKTDTQHHYAVILAGGQGTRFWPLSRRSRPKQFLPILGSRSLFQQTLQRLRPQIPGRRILVITGQGYRKIALEQSRAYAVPKENILLEPEGKNTAPAICWAAQHLFQQDRDATMAVLPADHLIKSTAMFRRYLSQALALAGQKFLVTMGIKPYRPETGFGYIQAVPVRCGRRKIHRVEKFTEKPALRLAQDYVKSGTHYWNSGMFFWRADEILTEFAIHLPRIYELIFGRSTRQIRKDWPRLPAMSIDYGILEKAENVAVIPAAGLGWSDVGSWEALAEQLPKDRQGNSLSVQDLAWDCRSTAVVSDGGLTVTVGLEDTIVVRTEDAVLVCRRDQSQKVREVVQVLNKQGRVDVL